MPFVPGGSKDPSRRSATREYIRHAFLYPWNLLLFLGGAGLAVLSPQPAALLPIVGALELAYLTGMMAIPRFRTAIDAKMAKAAREDVRPVNENAQASLQRILDSLPPNALRRFVVLRQRCFEMRDIASGVRGHAAGTSDSSESIRTPALDRLLFLFIKLLTTQDGLERFLRATSESELSLRLEDVRARLTTAQAASDERVTRSLQDSVADAELRLDNYRKSVKDADFVGIELDRIETKIQTLTEMGVSRQDPDMLSHQVTAAAESMQHTEDAVNQLQHLTGLADQIAETPAILEADLGRALIRDR